MKLIPRKHSHCSFCGHPFAPRQPWPRFCAACGNVTYRNPLPVVVVLVPVDSDGVLVIRRGEKPKKGQLALPGGFIEVGESWQEAAVRELREETRMRADPDEVREYRVRSATDGTLLVMAIVAPRRQEDLPAFTPTGEVEELLVLRAPAPLAFALHTEAVRDFLTGVGKSP
ncbi:MAG: NUDIX domain-containing protein [Myxococcota bacterium]